jgi:hypothetical protein
MTTHLAEAIAEPRGTDTGLVLDVSVNTTAGFSLCMYIEKSAQK